MLASAQGPVRFEKLTLTDRYYCDGIATGDINGDGKLDVVAGPFWYAGPEFKDAHQFYQQQPFPTAPSPSNSMFSFVHDFSGDGKPDILVLGRVHMHEARWYENPGDGSPMWKRHYAFERVRGESPQLVDLDGDGKKELTTHWENRWGTIQPDVDDYRKPWKFTPIDAAGDWNQWYHGQGTGDLNKDGRVDMLLNDGWLEQPPEKAKPWTFHRGKFSRTRGGAQMFAYDVDGDGDRDVITSLDAHGWGLAWFEQVAANARVTDEMRTMGPVKFVPHPLMGNRDEKPKYGVAFSQPHAVALADIDGDGLKDIVTGKRRWAHGPKGDVEPNAEPVVYWFRLSRDASGEVKYTPHLIDEKSGVGVQVEVTDVNGDGRPDVLSASKLGAFVFLNRQP
jgi:hypothetical protein